MTTHTRIRSASVFHSTLFSCDAKLGNLAHLALLLGADLVRGAPPELHRLDLLCAVARVEHVHFLRDAAALLGGELAARLGLQLQLVSLRVMRQSKGVTGCRRAGCRCVPL